MSESAERYYQSILDQIAASPFVQSQELTHDSRGDFVLFIRGNIHFADGSRLHLRELTDTETIVQRIAYVYHYQRADGALVFRYDNTAHYPGLPNAPHHKHDGGEENVVSAQAPDLAAVIREIEDLLTTRSETDQPSTPPESPP